LGSDADRPMRNRLQSRWLSKQCANWIADKATMRRALAPVPQGAVVLRNHSATPEQVVIGSFALSTDGLGIIPGNPLNLIQASESPSEAMQLAVWFDHQWSALHAKPEAKDALIQCLWEISEHRDPVTI